MVNENICLQVDEAFEDRDAETFEKLLAKHPECLRRKDGSDKWMWKAASRNQLPLINALLEVGIGINETNHPPDNQFFEPEGVAIQQAAQKGHLELVRWLLDHGAEINFEFKGQKRCWPLVGAATQGHFEVVKLLVERGADIHGCYNNVNAVTQAETYGQFEIRDYLLSLGAKDIRDIIPPDFAIAHKLLRKWLGSENGPTPGWQVEVPGEPAVTIHHAPPTQDDPYETLFTVGLSDKNLPEDRFRFAHNELRMMLKPGWKLDDRSQADPRWSWPVDWLKRLVSEIRSGEKWPDEPVLFMNGDSPAPLAAGTEMCGWICLHSMSGAGSFTLPDCRIAIIMDLFPIYAEEAKLVRDANDSEVLIDRFCEADVPLYVDPKRKNVG